jgi:hypothetical protein
LIGFQAVLLLLQQNPKYEVHIVAYLPRLDTAVRPNDKSARVSGNSMDLLQVAI